MKSFVVRIQVREPGITTRRYMRADGLNGSEAISAARKQMEREGEPRNGARAFYWAKPCSAGVVNPWI